MAKTLKVLAAAAAGLVAGVLLAPKSGEETRADIKRKAKEIKQQTKLAAEDAGSHLKQGASKIEKEARGMGKSASASAGVVRGEAGKLASEAKERGGRVAKEAKATAARVKADAEKNFKK